MGQTTLESTPSEGIAEETATAPLSSSQILQVLEESNKKISGWGKFFATLRGFVLGTYTVISLSLITISLLVAFGTITFAAVLSWPVVLPLLGVAVMVGLILGKNGYDKEILEQQQQETLIANSKKITAEYEAEVHVDEEEFKKIMGTTQDELLETCKKNIRAYIQKNPDENLDPEEIIANFEEKYLAIQENAIADFTSLQENLDSRVKKLNQPKPQISLWKAVRNKVAKLGSLFRNPMGIAEGSTLLGAGAAGSALAAGTGFTSAAAAGGAVAGAIVVAGCDILYENKIVVPRKEMHDRLMKEEDIKEYALGQIRSIKEECSDLIRQEYENIVEGIYTQKQQRRIDTLQAQEGHEFDELPAYHEDHPPPSYFAALQESRQNPRKSSTVNEAVMVRTHALSSLETLEGLETSSKQISGLGKFLAGLRGFVLGAYTIISLALITISLLVAFGAITFAAVLSWPIVLPILGVAVIAGLILGHNAIDSEKEEQLKQRELIEISKKPTKEYSEKVDIHVKEFEMNFDKKQLQMFEEGKRHIRQYAAENKLHPEDEAAVLAEFEKKYQKIKQNAQAHFWQVKNDLEIKAKKLNDPKPEVSLWQTIKNRVAKWGSLLRNTMGIFEGTAILAGSTAAGGIGVVGTGFASAAVAGGAIVGVVVVAGCTIAYEQKIVAPRKEMNIKLTDELAMKVEATRSVDTIQGRSSYQILKAGDDSIKELDRRAKQRKIHELERQHRLTKEYVPDSGYVSDTDAVSPNLQLKLPITPQPIPLEYIAPGAA